MGSHKKVATKTAATSDKPKSATPAAVAKFKANALKVLGSTVVQEPNLPVYWPVVWIDASAPAHAHIKNLAETISSQRRQQYISLQLQDKAQAVSSLDSSWSFCLSDVPGKDSYVILTFKFGPPLSIEVPILFTTPKHLPILSSIFTCGRIMWTTAVPGKREDFIFADLQPTADIEGFLISEITKEGLGTAVQKRIRNKQAGQST